MRLTVDSEVILPFRFSHAESFSLAELSRLISKASYNIKPVKAAARAGTSILADLAGINHFIGVTHG